MSRYVNAKTVIRDLTAVKEQSPLVHNITNYVVMNNTANALLAIGASPVMAHAVEEMEEMASIASSLVLNIGTLSPEWVEAMRLAGITAHRRNIPIVLDPVGAGATSYRTKTSLDLIGKCHPTIIRGNASEIMAIAPRSKGKEAIVSSCSATSRDAMNMATTPHSQGNGTKGVDSSAGSSDAVESAKVLSLSAKAIVVISGPTDYITDGERVAEIHNGAEIMTRVTGLGCTASALVGAFAAVNQDPFDASVSAMAVMGIAGEIAASRSRGNGSMQINFLDELYNLSAKEIEDFLR